MKIGTKIKFKKEKQRYTVQGFNERFIICTKPFNARKTYLYTIIDLKEEVRGPDDLVFGFPYGYDSPAKAKIALKWLMNQSHKGIQIEVSHRRRIPLDIEKIYEKGSK